MPGFVVGLDRGQATLLPECLEDWVDESNPVRAVDVFVDALELRDLGFDGVDPAATGRPAYTTNHLIVAHAVTNVGTDKSQLANMANQAKAALQAESLEAFADRGDFKCDEILACEESGITVTLPKPQTSDAKSEGRFGKQEFRYLADEDTYICPPGEKLTNHFTNEENRLGLYHYWTNA